MVKYANYAGLLSLLMSLPTVGQVLDDHASELGRDLTAYWNHVYRVVNMGDSRFEPEKIAVAAAFHDLGIWTNEPSRHVDPICAPRWFDQRLPVYA